MSTNLKLLAFNNFFANLLLNLNAADKTNRTKFLSAFTSKAFAPLSKLVFLIIAASSLVLAGACLKN